jgi:hypothetical protein
VPFVTRQTLVHLHVGAPSPPAPDPGSPEPAWPETAPPESHLPELGWSEPASPEPAFSEPPHRNLLPSNPIRPLTSLPGPPSEIAFQSQLFVCYPLFRSSRTPLRNSLPKPYVDDAFLIIDFPDPSEIAFQSPFSANGLRPASSRTPLRNSLPKPREGILLSSYPFPAPSERVLQDLDGPRRSLSIPFKTSSERAFQDLSLPRGRRVCAAAWQGARRFPAPPRRRRQLSFLRSARCTTGVGGRAAPCARA